MNTGVLQFVLEARRVSAAVRAGLCILFGLAAGLAAPPASAQRAAPTSGNPSPVQPGGTPAGQQDGPDLKPTELIDQLFTRAREALRLRESEAAESDARFIVSASLDQLGAIYNVQRRWDDAEEAYLQAARASAFAAESLMGLGIVYLRSGRYDEGRQTLKQLLRLNPLNPDPHHLLGKILFMEGDYQGASSELRDAYSLGPGDLSVAYTLALAYLKQQRPEEAAKVFAQMEEKVGSSPRFMVLRGRALRETGYLEEAILQFRRAIERDSNFPRAHYYLGLTLLMRHHRDAFGPALEHFQTELERSPDHYPSLFFSGVVLASEQRHQEALPLLERACQLEPERPDPHLFLGQTLLKLGRFEEAVEHLRQTIQLTPDPKADRFRVANAHFSLGQALLRSGRREEAQVHIATAQQLKQERFDWEAEAVEKHMKGSGAAGADSADQADELVTRPSADALPPAQEAEAAALQFKAALASHGETSLMLVDLQPQDDSSDPAQNQTAAYYRRTASSAYQLLARIYVQREDFAQAADFLGLAGGWDDQSPDLYFNWALACMKAQQPECAVQPLINDLERHPRRDAAKGMLAQAALQLVESDQGEAAKKAVDFLLGLHPEVPDLHLLKGRVLAVEGRFEAARESFVQARRLNPAIAEVHYFEGMALLRQSKLDLALESFDRQLAKTPEHPKALYHKAFLLDALGRSEEAPALLQKAIAADPGYAQPYYQLGKMQLKQGQVLQATMNLETASRLSPQAAYIHYQLSRAYARAGRQDDARQALERYRALKKLEEEARLESVRRQPEQGSGDSRREEEP
ncbi:MAG TPA: tetratricopeptide repeat protein [Acidobacteriota bacterium]|nr:tetratricopeptide repeat protein [Acidobacteriota bacterium]